MKPVRSVLMLDRMDRMDRMDRVWNSVRRRISFL